MKKDIGSVEPTHEPVPSVTAKPKVVNAYEMMSNVAVLAEPVSMKPSSSSVSTEEKEKMKSAYTSAAATASTTSAAAANNASTEKAASKKAENKDEESKPKEKKMSALFTKEEMKDGAKTPRGSRKSGNGPSYSYVTTSAEQGKKTKRKSSSSPSKSA